jgi:hypothetical protein
VIHTKEAFDSVWRDGLYFILHAYGVRGKLLRLIVAWHDDATATGLWYQTESSPINYSQGVRQGCILAPALYAAFLNPVMGDKPPVADHPFPELHAWAFQDGLSREDGLPTSIPSAENGYKPRRVPGLMYADDVAILACTREGAEANFNKYIIYMRKWRARLSLSKCHLLVFGKQTSKVQPIVCPCGHMLTPEPSVKYLGVTLDKCRSSQPQLAESQAKGRTGSHLLYQLAHSMGEDFADQVTQRKVLPAALYGLEATFLNDVSLKKLDTISDHCHYRAHLLPYAANKECRQFETPTLPASLLVASHQANMYLKLTNTYHEIRTPLVKMVSNETTSGGSIHAGWARTFRNLRKVGVHLTTAQMSKPHTKNSRQDKVRLLKTRLLRDHAKALTASKATIPTRTSGGRSKLDLFYKLVGPMTRDTSSPAYSESMKLGLISNTKNRSILRHIRCGLVGNTKATFTTARTRPPSVPACTKPCTCDPTGSTHSDSTHCVLECPNTLPSRQRVCQALRVALPLKEAGIRPITNSISDQDLILASLGAPLPLLPPHKHLYGVFINAAAKAWADEADSLGVCLKVSA